MSEQEFHPKLITFDLNGTLIANNSWLELNRAMGITAEEDAELMRRATAGEISDADGNAELLAMYKMRGNVSRVAIEAILYDYTLQPGARELVQYCHDKGHEMAIVSGAMNVLVEHIATDLGIHHWRSGVEFVFGAEDMLVGMKSAEYEHRGKLENLQTLAAELAVPLNHVVHIGDGTTDIPLFVATNHGITFLTSKSEVRSAARHTVHSLSDILNFV